MRLIDADALVKCVNKIFGLKPDARWSHGAVLNTIEAAPTIGEWISVKDRLPEPGISVIIYGTPKEDPEHTDGKIAITYMSEWNLLDSRIKTEPYWIMPWQYFSFDYTITHWMPLPEPPEEVAKAE